MPPAHNTTEEYWKFYSDLSRDIQAHADKQFALLKSDSLYPFLHFKQVGVRGGQELWSARVNKEYRELASRRTNGWLWWWIGHHKEYEFSYAKLCY